MIYRACIVLFFAHDLLTCYFFRNRFCVLPTSSHEHLKTEKLHGVCKNLLVVLAP